MVTDCTTMDLQWYWSTAESWLKGHSSRSKMSKCKFRIETHPIIINSSVVEWQLLLIWKTSGVIAQVKAEHFKLLGNQRTRGVSAQSKFFYETPATSIFNISNANSCYSWGRYEFVVRFRWYLSSVDAQSRNWGPLQPSRRRNRLWSCVRTYLFQLPLSCSKISKSFSVRWLCRTDKCTLQMLAVGLSTSIKTR